MNGYCLAPNSIPISIPRSDGQDLITEPVNNMLFYFYDFFIFFIWLKIHYYKITEMSSS